MAFSTASSGPSGPQMNVTPLIDVLLVLLIIFMLVAINDKPKGLNAEIPQPASVNPNIPPPQATIVIQVKHAKPGDEHPQVTINKDVVE